MIRNVVFDMGNVLLDFHTRDAAASFADTAQDARLLHQAVFESPWWIRMDRGGDEDSSLQAMLRDLPQRLHERAGRMMETWDDWLFPTGVNTLAEKLKEKGYGIYLLSNTSERFNAFQHKAPAIAKMDGRVLSWEEGILKPDPEIYRLLLARYDLKAEECFFIDDSPPNIECAWRLGMEAYCFRGDLPALERELKSRGVEL